MIREDSIMRDPYEQLQRIRHALTKITEYTLKGRESFDKREEIRLAIVFYIQMIDQAIHAVPQNFKEQHPEIPWEKMNNIQTLFIPYSIEPDRDAIWQIVSYDLPLLKPKIDAILAHRNRTSEQKRDIDFGARGTNKTKALRELLQTSREDILRIATKYGASNVRIFGSVARGEADSDSDIDLLVDMEPDRTLLDLAELLTDLQNLLGHRLDIVTEEGLNERLRERVLKETVVL